MDINELRKNSIEERDGFFQPAVFVDVVATVGSVVVTKTVSGIIDTKKSGGYVDNLAMSNYTNKPQYVCEKQKSAKRRNKMLLSIADCSISL